MSNGQTISPELRQWMVAQLAAGHSIPALRISMREPQNAYRSLPCRLGSAVPISRRYGCSRSSGRSTP